MKEKDSYKILVVTDIHDDIEKIKILVDKVKDIKFDFVFCCGDAVSVPIDKNDDTEVTKEYILKLKNIFTELEKIGHIYWVPGNHEPGIYFTTNEEPTKDSENLHKKIKKLDDNFYIVGLGGSVPIMTGRKWKHNFVLFKELNLEKDFKYGGYPYNVTPNDFHKSDDLFIKDLNETVDIAKKEGGENIQILYLTHIGPLYTSTNTIVENGEVLYLGSKNFGEKFLKEDNGFIIVHGHSHTAEGYITMKSDRHIFNPGCCCEGHYGILDLKKDKNGKWGVGSCTVAYL
jgi:Icc-related predicted phosphoesterase